MRFVGIADDEGNSGETGDLLRGALRVTTGDNDASGRIRRVDFADGVAGLSVCGGGDGASIENNDVRRRAIERDGAALIPQLALDGGAVGLCGATAELFDVESSHVMRLREYLSTEAWCGNSERVYQELGIRKRRFAGNRVGQE